MSNVTPIKDKAIEKISLTDIDLDVHNPRFGNGEFTELVGASVKKANLGFGVRSWRYAMVVNDNVVEHVFAEEGFGDNIDTDPYEVSAPENVLANI